MDKLTVTIRFGTLINVLTFNGVSSFIAEPAAMGEMNLTLMFANGDEIAVTNVTRITHGV